MISIALPAELTSLSQWLLWRYVQRPGTPKPTKVPITCQGYKADVTDPANWSRYEVTIERSQRPGFCDGIGFVFNEADDFCGLDLDHIWPSDAAETPAWAQQILDRFADTYSEESPSGEGSKIWCKAKAPRCGSWKVEGGGVEIYDRARYFAVTGKSNRGRVITDHQADVDLLVSKLDARQPQQSPQIDGMIRYGVQHSTLVSLGGTMHRRGMCPEAILAALLEANKHQCERPGPEENIRKIVASMKRWDR